MKRVDGRRCDTAEYYMGTPRRGEEPSKKMYAMSSNPTRWIAGRNMGCWLLSR